MIETRPLKNVILIQTVLSFLLLKRIINIYKHFVLKYGNVTVKDFQKFVKP